MESTIHRSKWKTLLAFATIYFVWGSTFLAIRVGVREVPPLLLAAIRFLIAGVILYVWMTVKGARSPTARQYVNPVVAVLLGYFLAGEALGLRTILAALLVLISVIVITTKPTKKLTSVISAEDTPQTESI